MVISDATVLIALAKTRSLWLLKELWKPVVIPEAVKNEVLSGTLGSLEITKAINSGWIKIKEVQNQRLVRILQNSIRGKGECECIVPAEEIGAGVILTDDKKARKIIAQSGMAVIGTLGLFIQAVEGNALSKEEAITIIDKLKETNFRLSEGVVNRAIELIREITRK